jgi:ATP-dependent helicase HrpB
MATTPAVRLPVDHVLGSLRDALRNHSHCLLVAQPGAGKTTRVPLALLTDTAADQRWLLLEPRRVAARLAAVYMAEQLGENVGQTVGYRVRGDSRVSASTRLEVLTQGILTRMLQDDPALQGVAGVIFDEFHERSLDADLSLALTLDAQQALRPDLKVLVMSATLDTDALLTVLGPDTPVIDCPGRSFPVNTLYRAAPLREAPELHQSLVIREALSAHDGHMLVFLPGQREIRRLQQTLKTQLSADIEVCPLHGQLTLAAQQAVLRPAADGPRRIILSTAIAESSLTVPGVRIVVDSGRERVPVIQPRTGLTRLETRQVNRASADQRRGRAGREAEGFCYRLWSEESLLARHREPEILQSDLSGLVYELARWGVADASTLRWVTPPPSAAMQSSRQLLTDLGLLQTDGQLSESGRRCARWPTHPRLARLLEHAAQSNDADMQGVACLLVAWLEESPGSDQLDLSDALVNLAGELNSNRHSGSARRWWHSAAQWAKRLGCPLPEDVAGEVSAHAATHIAALLLSAYPDRVAVSQAQGQFKLISGGQAVIPGDHRLAREHLISAVELDGQADCARIFSALALPAEVLKLAFPEALTWQAHAWWDNKTGRLVAEECQRLRLGRHELILARRPASTPITALPAEEVRSALLQAMQERGTLPWSENDRQLLGRLRLLHATLGSPWPAVEDNDLLDALPDWLGPHLDGLHRLDQVDRLPLGQLLRQNLDWSLQRELDTLTPTHISVPSGSSIAIDYSGPEPILAVKLQEMFGQTETPAVINGKVSLLIHLLSPARRPVQVTRDLSGFWASSYFEVRKDLRGRYPKHPWPENPLEAQATKWTKNPKRNP